MQECVLVACPGDDRDTEKSESSTKLLIQPTIPLMYLPPVVLTTSGAPPGRKRIFCDTCQNLGRVLGFCNHLSLLIITNLEILGISLLGKKER